MGAEQPAIPGLGTLSTDRVYKVLRAAEWQALQQDGCNAGSAVDRRDGYIHLSTALQLAGTLARHFAEEADLCLYALDPASLGEALRYEPSRDGQRFPHLYALLRCEDCVPLAVRPRPDAPWQPWARGD